MLLVDLEPWKENHLDSIATERGDLSPRSDQLPGKRRGSAFQQCRVRVRGSPAGNSFCGHEQVVYTGIGRER